MQQHEHLLGQVLCDIPRYVRCRESHNPFSKFGQNLLALHRKTRRSVAIISFGCGSSRRRARYNSSVARVLMVSSEAAPLAKTGGLADVVGALPSALRAFGDETAVVIPRYGSIDLKGTRRVYDSLPVFLGPKRYDTAIYQAAE